VLLALLRAKPRALAELPVAGIPLEDLSAIDAELRRDGLLLVLTHRAFVPLRAESEGKP
jgi:hypothetical protein